MKKFVRAFVCECCKVKTSGVFAAPGNVCPVCLSIIRSGKDVERRIAARRDYRRNLSAKS